MESVDVAPHFELRFPSLFDEGRGLSFPCDREGRVDLDGMSDRARSNYLFARATIGREFDWPSVQAQPAMPGHARKTLRL